MKKAIYIDLDGTLLDNSYKISKKDKNFLFSIKENWNIILSTGNSLRNTINFYNELDLNTFLSTSQGQVITNPKKNETIYNELNFDDIKKIMDSKKIINFLIETHDETYTKNKKGILIDLIKNSFQIYKNQKIKKIISFYIEVSRNFSIKIDNLDHYEWETNKKNKIISFKPLKISKLSAFKTINAKEKYEFTIAIGDGRNDIGCLKNANIGIAMKNSHPLVLKNANYVSNKTNNESGVSDILEKIIKKINL